MANIRASGFDSKSELQEHLLELVPENEPDGDGEADVNRAAEVELAWLRKEVAELRGQFSAMASKAAEPRSAGGRGAFWLKVALAAVAAGAIGTLIPRL